MINTWALLLASRKFWLGTITVLATVAAVVLRALDKIPADALVPTMAVIASTGISVIGSVAWEDAASKAGARRSAIAEAEKKTVRMPRVVVLPADLPKDGGSLERSDDGAKST